MPDCNLLIFISFFQHISKPLLYPNPIKVNFVAYYRRQTAKWERKYREINGLPQETGTIHVQGEAKHTNNQRFLCFSAPPSAEQSAAETFTLKVSLQSDWKTQTEAGSCLLLTTTKKTKMVGRFIYLFLLATVSLDSVCTLPCCWTTSGE